MTESPPRSQSPVAAAVARDVDAACRPPLFALFGGAALWIFLASALQLLVSIKFHSPDFLSGTAWLTYGRLHATANTAFLYGFAVPAGLAAALRIFSRSNGVPVRHSWLVTLGAAIWHAGVLVAVLAILAGNGSGHENLQMPRYAAWLLFLGYSIAALWTVLILAGRSRARLSAPQWYLLTALLWFPWIFTTASLLLLTSPVRGVDQAVIDWWYSGNLLVVWSGLAGLGTAFYFLGVDADPEGQRDYRTLFGFWTLILFGSWVGIPASAPVPAWMPTLSTVCTVLLAVPLLTMAGIVAAGVSPAIKGATLPPGTPPSNEGPDTGTPGATRRAAGIRFIRFGVLGWLAAVAMKIVSALPPISPYLDFTWFAAAQWQLNAFGFLAMILFGAIYETMPRLTGVDWRWPGAVRAHFWCAAIGILLVVVPLAAGGVVQGIQLNDSRIAFQEVSRSSLLWLRMSTIGDTLIVAGNVLLALNLAGSILRHARSRFVQFRNSLRAAPAPAEVAS